jgi:hypothetical protein
MTVLKNIPFMEIHNLGRQRVSNLFDVYFIHFPWGNHFRWMIWKWDNKNVIKANIKDCFKVKPIIVYMWSRGDKFQIRFPIHLSHSLLLSHICNDKLFLLLNMTRTDSSDFCVQFWMVNVVIKYVIVVLPEMFLLC